MGVWYATRQDVSSAYSIKGQHPRSNAQVDRALERASRTVEGILHRIFYPRIATKTFNWPQPQGNKSYRIWLGDNELSSLTSITSGGVSQTVGDFFLEPNEYGPPYDRIETNRGSSTTFNSGVTEQRAIAITGVYCGTEGGPQWNPAGQLVGSVNSSVLSLTISDSSLIGVGSLLQIGTEWLRVTNQISVSSGTALSADIDAKQATTLVAVSDGTKVNVGERILVDAEYMFVVDKAGNNLIVSRADSGSVLAAHTNTTTVYVPRVLTVTRGDLGSAAVAHNNTDAISYFAFPGPVISFTVGLALNEVEQEKSAYSGTSGSGDNKTDVTGGGLDALMRDAIVTCGRQGRIGAV